MAINIDILTKFQSVKDAQKSIEQLGASLENVQGLSDLGGLGFDPSQSERLKEMVAQVNRLNTISGQGERKGGFLSKQQFQEASRMMQQLTQNIQNYGKELDKLKQKHAELGREERQLLDRIATGRGTAADISRRNDIRRQRNDVGEDIDRMQKDEDRVQRIRRDARHAQSSIGGMEQQESNSNSSIKKAVGFALAAAGVGGPLAMLFGFLSKSRATYQQAIGHEATLGARGIRGGFGNNIDVGIGPLEQMGLLENISQSTGLSGDKANRVARTAGVFGRYTGTTPDQIAALYSTGYQSTGKETAGDNAVNTISKAMDLGLKKAKVPELLGLVNKHTQLTAQAMGGAALSDKQMSMASAWASFAMLQKDASLSHFAKSDTFGNILQNGFKGTGSGPGDMILFKALGGFDGKLSLEKLAQMQRIREDGPQMHPEILSKVISSMPGAGVGEGSGKSYMMTQWLSSYGLTMKGADALQQLMKGDIFKKIQSYTASGKEIPKELQGKWEKEVNSLPGMSKMAQEAKWQDTQLKTGELLNEALIKWQELATKMIDSLISSGGAQKLAEAINKLAGFAETPAMKGVGFAAEHPVAAATGTAAVLLGGGKILKAGKSLIGGIPKPTISSGGGSGFAMTAAEEAAGMAPKGAGVLGKVAPWLTLAALPSEIYGDYKRFSERGKEMKYFDSFKKAGSKYGIDPVLLMSIAKQESGFNPKAKSKVGATGIMQLMPGTYSGYGLSEADAYDPDKNIMAGARHIAELKKRFPNASIGKILAMYNWGEGNYTKKGGMQNLPKETSKYIASVDENYRQYTGGALGGKRIVDWEKGGASNGIDKDYLTMVAEIGRIAGDALAEALKPLVDYVRVLSERQRTMPSRH